MFLRSSLLAACLALGATTPPATPEAPASLGASSPGSEDRGSPASGEALPASGNPWIAEEGDCALRVTAEGWEASLPGGIELRFPARPSSPPEGNWMADTETWPTRIPRGTPAFRALEGLRRKAQEWDSRPWAQEELGRQVATGFFLLATAWVDAPAVAHPSPERSAQVPALSPPSALQPLQASPAPAQVSPDPDPAPFRPSRKRKASQSTPLDAEPPAGKKRAVASSGGLEASPLDADELYLIQGLETTLTVSAQGFQVSLPGGLLLHHRPGETSANSSWTEDPARWQAHIPEGSPAGQALRALRKAAKERIAHPGLQDKAPGLGMLAQFLFHTIWLEEAWTDLTMPVLPSLKDLSPPRPPATGSAQALQAPAQSMTPATEGKALPAPATPGAVMTEAWVIRGTNILLVATDLDYRLVLPSAPVIFRTPDCQDGSPAFQALEARWKAMPSQAPAASTALTALRRRAGEILKAGTGPAAPLKMLAHFLADSAGMEGGEAPPAASIEGTSTAQVQVDAQRCLLLAPAAPEAIRTWILLDLVPGYTHRISSGARWERPGTLDGSPWKLAHRLWKALLPEDSSDHAFLAKARTEATRALAERLETGKEDYRMSLALFLRDSDWLDERRPPSGPPVFRAPQAVREKQYPRIDSPAVLDRTCFRCRHIFDVKRTVQNHLKWHEGTHGHACTHGFCGASYGARNHLTVHTELAHALSCMGPCATCEEQGADRNALVILAAATDRARQEQNHRAVEGLVKGRLHLGQAALVAVSQQEPKPRPSRPRTEGPSPSSSAQPRQRIPAAQGEADAVPSPLKTPPHSRTPSSVPAAIPVVPAPAPDSAAQNAWACFKCRRIFRVSEDLETHDRLYHMSSLPHACGHCGATFRVKEARNMHEASHTKSCLHPCEVCEAQGVPRKVLEARAEALEKARKANDWRTLLALVEGTPHEDDPGRASATLTPPLPAPPPPIPVLSPSPAMVQPPAQAQAEAPDDAPPRTQTRARSLRQALDQVQVQAPNPAASQPMAPPKAQAPVQAVTTPEAALSEMESRALVGLMASPIPANQTRPRTVEGLRKAFGVLGEALRSQGRQLPWLAITGDSPQDLFVGWYQVTQLSRLVVNGQPSGAHPPAGVVEALSAAVKDIAELRKTAQAQAAPPASSAAPRK